VGVDGVGQDRVQQLHPAGEPTVQGADADPGPAGDLLQRRLQAVVAEHLPGGGEDGVPVALGVAAQRPGGLWAVPAVVRGRHHFSLRECGG
jgi:hypothetical protein